MTTHPPAATQSAAQEWFTPRRFTFILACLIVAAYFPVLSGGKSFYIRDFGFFGYPLASYHRDAFWRGEIPLWNPLSCNGLPFLAQWNTLVLYPGSLIYLLLPLPWSLNVFCLTHLFLAGMGAYYLAYHWTGDRLAASVAGMAFAFNGLTLNCLMWPNNIAALGWMPWVIWAADLACCRGGRKVVIAALIGAVQMLSGAPEFIMITWALASGLVFVPALRKEGRWTFPTTELGRFALVVALITGLAAAQLLPFAELLKHSPRDLNTADTIAWSLPTWGWANFFVPLFRNYPRPMGTFFQLGQDWTSSYYLGTGILALALLGAWRARHIRSALLFAGFALGIIIALGPAGQVYTWIRQVVPQIGVIRFTVKFVLISVFCAPFLAAFAIQKLNATADSRTGTKLRRSMTAMAIIFLAIIAAIVWYARTYPLKDETFTVGWWHGAMRGIFLVATVWLAGKACRWTLRHVPIGGLALLLVIWLDVWTHTPNQNPAIPSEAFAPGLVHQRWEAQQLKPMPGENGFRAWTPRYAYEPLLGAVAPNGEEDFLLHRLALFANVNLIENIPIIDGFFSLYLSPQRDLWSLLYNASSLTNASRMFDLIGVTAISSPTNIFTWEGRTNALTFASIGQEPRFADPNGTLKALTSREFSSHTEAYLPTNAVGIVTAKAAPQARVISRSLAAHRIELETSSESPALLHLNHSYYPAWRATVDGQPTTIWQANHAFQAVEVPAGKHSVLFVYADQKFRLGAMVSLSTLAICGVLWRRGRSRNATASA